MDPSLRVALIHDWLTGMRGGEKVLEVFADLFPMAPIYTLLHVPGAVSAKLEAHPIITSRLQQLPLAATRYRHYLPLMPRLIEQFRVADADLVLSTSSCVAKSIQPPPGAVHASYILSPMRYLYDRYDDYFAPGRAGWCTRAAMRLVRRPLQRWDQRTMARVDSPVAISSFIAQRILSVYGRRARVIHPPVEVERFAAARRPPEDYYLIVSALVPYKNVDLAIEAFRRLDRRLIVAGSGPLLEQLRANCPANVELRGWVSDAEVEELVGGCRAFVFPNVEDFGIAPVEAMAAGRPVIALGAGGALDTVCDLDRWRAGRFRSDYGPTGLFFASPEPAALAEAVERFEREEWSFHPDAISAWARRFDTTRFIHEIKRWLTDLTQVPRQRLAA